MVSYPPLREEYTTLVLDKDGDGEEKKGGNNNVARNKGVNDTVGKGRAKRKVVYPKQDWPA